VIKAYSEELWKLIDKDAVVQRAATGFTFTEGPLWHLKEQHLLFSDVPGNVRRKYTPDGRVVEVRNPSEKCNGMTYDRDLNLVVCEHLTSSLVLERTDGKRETLASHFEEKELNSPNDVCVRSDCSIYFSDPWYGRMPGFGEPRDRVLDFQGVFRIASGSGDLELVVERERYEQPNGLCFSPDESQLYINDSPGALIDVYDVESDGSLSHRRRFAENIGTGELEGGIPDGMKCDEQGNIWVTGPKGVWVFNESGQPLGIVEIPEHVGNLHWGGSDWHTLYVAASTSIYTLPTRIGPHAEPFMV
jgi:gluconolactonase